MMQRNSHAAATWPFVMVASLVCAVVVGCDTGPTPAVRTAERSGPDDTDWYRRQLVDANAKPRLQFAIAENGFYRPNLGPDMRPHGEQRATLVTQSRAIYVMAAAYEVTGEKVYHDAAIKAADFLIDRFKSGPEPGRWASAVSPDGAVLDSDYHAYGQAQAMFALAHAYHSTKQKRFLEAALATWLQIDVPRLVQGQRPGRTLLGLNVAMHTFEAMLALYKAEPSKLLLADLRILGDYIVTRFFEPQRGFFYEDLGSDFRPAADSGIRLGHNVELAFLLSRGVDAGLPAKYLDPANRAIDFVVKYGIRRPEGGLPHELNYDGTLRDPALPWWCQTELMRGLAHFAKQRDRHELQSEYDASLAYAKAHFIDPVSGTWYPLADRPDLPRGGEWSAGYHVATMLTEVLRLRGTRFHSGPEMLL
jgi:mannose/cellobiose epimerase-like protein (N-acyl-D-glucosamine 2-epimerase family)